MLRLVFVADRVVVVVDLVVAVVVADFGFVVR